MNIKTIKAIPRIDPDDLVDKFSEELRKEIDKEIINEMANLSLKKQLKKQGWVTAPFTIDKFMWPLRHSLPDVSAWIHQNCTAGYRIVGKEFWFEKETDLTTFILKWS